MCCSVLVIFFLGPRLGLLIFWLLPSGRTLFNYAFQSLIVPVLGLIFLPWTTVAWTIFCGPNGMRSASFSPCLTSDIRSRAPGKSARKPFFVP